MKSLRIIALIIIINIKLQAQQLPYLSQLGDAKTYWNPAMTALNTSSNLDLFLRQQWVGFGGAPSTGFINYDYPFLKSNMGMGGSLLYDKTGPLSKIGVQLNYSYKVVDALGEDSQLSLGISAGGQNYSLNTANAIINQIEDPLLINNSRSGFFPSIGAGIHFISDTRGYKSDNSFFVGLAYQQAYQSNLLISAWNQKRFRHFILDFGTRLYGDAGYFEPCFTVNYVNPELLNLQLNAKFEMRDKFWAGLGYSTINDLSIQGGIIFNEVAGRDTKLRLGLLANAGITSNSLTNFGPGFEFFMRYELDLD